MSDIGMNRQRPDVKNKADPYDDTVVRENGNLPVDM
jgi:hypothetical protein